MLNWVVRNRTVRSFNCVYLQNIFTNHIFNIYIYKQDLALNNQQWLICYKTKPNQKEYKCRYDWVGKLIHRELRKKLKFDHTDKWYMHKPESVLEMHKILWDLNRSSNTGKNIISN